MNIIKRVLIGLIIFLVILVVVVGVYINRSIPRSFPQTDGTITIEGLEAPVDIYRDDLGIPHVFASSENDLLTICSSPRDTYMRRIVSGRWTYGGTRERDACPNY
jgi:hypothetical protein